MKITLDMLNELELPDWFELAWFTEYPTGERKFVLQKHEIGDSQHGDLRLKKNGFLEGLSIVGFSKTQPFSASTLLERKDRGFRAEPKARQPPVWIKVEGDIEPGKVGAGVEKAGKLTIVDKGTYWEGAIKPWFKEFFLNGNVLSGYIRCVVRAVKVNKLDPETKKPIPGQFERMWRFMITKDQTPYAIKRGRKRGWLPPKGVIPIPPDWRKEHKKEYEDWLAWATEGWKKHPKGVTMSSRIKFTLALASWMGPKHIRGIPRLRFYLLLDDRGEGGVKVFFIDGDPTRSNNLAAYTENRANRKWMSYEGTVQPNTRFNPNKALKGKWSIIDSGTAQYTSEVLDNKTVIHLVFNGKRLRGKWDLTQEEKGADFYEFEKLHELIREGRFTLLRHYWDGREHWDIFVDYKDFSTLIEINLWKNPLDISEPIRAIKKKCYDKEKWMITEGEKVRIKSQGLETFVDVLDSGTALFLEITEPFLSMRFEGKKLKGIYILKKENNMWYFSKSELPKASKRMMSLYRLLQELHQDLTS